MGSANGSPCIFDFKCNTTALAACERGKLIFLMELNYKMFC